LVLDSLLAGSSTPEQILANIDRVLDPKHIPTSLRNTFIALIQQLVAFNVDRWAQQYRPFLGVLAVARRGLTLTQLVGVTGRPQSEVADNLRVLGRFLVGEAPNGPYRLFHAAFGTFMLNEPEYGVSAAEAHEAIAAFLLAEHGQDWLRCTDAAALGDTSYHLLAAVQHGQDQRKRRELLDQLVDLMLEPAYLQARLAAAAPDELLEDLEVVAALAVQHPRGTELVALKSFFIDNADELDRRRADPAWLAERLRKALAVPTFERPDGVGVTGSEIVASQSRTTDMPSSDQASGVPLSPAPDEASARRAEEALRRQIPPSVLIELGVWRRAKINGYALLVISALVCVPVLMVAFGVWPLSFPTGWIRPVYWVIVLAAVFLLYTAWVESRGRGNKVDAVSSSDIDSASAYQEWETLQEIVDLRAGGKRFRLLGDILIASPYFELVVIVFLVTLVVTTFSRETTPFPSRF